MILKSITLHNFRQFKGDNDIEFASNEDKNVTLILGENTSGKTTFVQAFNWVLYGKAYFKSQDILNKDVQDSMAINTTEYVRVALKLVHDKIEYIIDRKADYKCVTSENIRCYYTKVKVSYKTPDGQTKLLDDYEVETSINRILPDGLSGYFFFDGERINNISSKQDVASSVKGLMGLDVLESTKEHLDSVIRDLRKSLNSEGDKDMKKVQMEIDQREREYEAILKQKNVNDTSTDYYLEKKNSLAAQLKENEETSKLQQDKVKLEKSINQAKNDYDSSIEHMVNMFNTETSNFFGYPLFAKALEIVEKNQFIDESIDGINAKAIDEIIRRNKCICGCEIIIGGEREQHLLKERKFMPPESIGTLIRNYKKNLSSADDKYNSFRRNLKAPYELMKRIDRDKASMKDELSLIRAKLNKSKDMKQVEEEYWHTDHQIKKFGEAKVKLIKDEAVCENEIRKLKKQIDFLSSQKSVNDRINISRMYASSLYEWINEYYQDKETQIREQLEEKVNSIFKRMYHGNRTISINNNYKVAYSDIKTDESGGLETVKNFAFIAGLVDLAREKIHNKNVDESVETDDYYLNIEPYPLVMDAPFSKADEEHVRNISKILPEIAEQVIMVLMGKDWVYAKNELDKHLGKKYIIEKKSETYSVIHEQEAVNV